MDDRWMSLPQAANELGCTRHTVLAAVIRGELEAELVADRTVISRESVAQLKAKREQDARAAAV